MSEIQKLVGIDEEDNEDDAEMGVKEEDDEDDDEERNNLATPMIDADAGIISSSSNSQFQSPDLGNQGGSSRRSRPLEEKERTKLRERHRRAITARILAGLRRHGNYNLRVRADINDVISALAREAGWVVLPDGTTFPNRSQGLKSVGTSPAIGTTQSPQMLAPQTPASTVGGISPGHHGPIEYNAGQMKGVFTPSSFPYDLSSNQAVLSSSLVGVGAEQLENLPLAGHPMGIGSEKQERDFAGTSFVPVFMMLPLGVINVKCELVDPDNLVKQLRILKSANIDGVMVDCWWGIVEAQAPQEYNWDGYRRLFHIVHELRLRLQVVMSFHECGGNLGDDVCIPLPHWVVEIGRSNPDIYFTDREGRRNPECLSWGIDKERVLRGRTAIEVYFDFMRSFRVEFDEFFKLGIISMIEVGLGPCGDLRYPSYPVKHGWRFPGVGEFQCYDQYMLKSLRKAAEARGHSYWGRGPDNAGSYNSRPYETGFFCDKGDYDGYYGRFFLKWYSQFLVDHADRVLSLAKLAFEGTSIAAKLSGIHWWYRTASHAAELTAGFHNSSNRDGYTAIVAMLKKHEATLNLTYTGVPLLGHHEEFQEALADPDGLVWQVLNAAWEACVPVASVNSFPCHDQEGYNKILGDVKPENNPDSRHFATFTFLRLSPVLMERNNFMQFERFVKRMHGLPVLDQQM